jgi:hypothetical protein
MNRHWSISTHLVTDQKTRIIQLRRSRLSKRRILLRNDRSTLLDKKNHSTERIERLNPFLSWYQSIQHSLSRTVIRAKINSSSRFTKSDWTFSKQTSFSFFIFSHNQLFSQSNFLADFYQDDKRNINQSLSLRIWLRSRSHSQSWQKHLRTDNNNLVWPRESKEWHTMRAI